MQCDDCIYTTDDNVCTCEDVIFDIEDECLSKIDTETYNRIYNKAIDDSIVYFEEHASEVWNHISARDFICDSLEELKVGRENVD